MRRVQRIAENAARWLHTKPYRGSLCCLPVDLFLVGWCVAEPPVGLAKGIGTGSSAGTAVPRPISRSVVERAAVGRAQSALFVTCQNKEGLN